MEKTAEVLNAYPANVQNMVSS